MRSQSAQSALIGGALLLTLVAGTAQAIEQKPLPLFRLLAPDGATVVSSNALPGGEQWLLVYVSPGCPSCDLLLAALKGWQNASLIQHTIVVVGAPTAAAAQQYIQR